MGHRNADRYFYATPDRLKLDRFQFPTDEERHIFQVLRLVEGTVVTVADGEGKSALVRLERIEGKWTGLIVDRFDPETLDRFELTVAAGLLKGRELDSVVGRCTEIGVDRIIPFLSERTVPDLSPGKEKSRVERLDRIAISAMKLARSATRPFIEPVAGWGDLCSTIPGYDLALLCDQDGAEPLQVPDATGRVLLLVGPEGGLTEGEKELAAGAGARPATLSRRNLSAATAAIVAAALTIGADR